MIPCYICGQDASTGWTKGFVPAPDSQKLALCALHNSPENRLLVVMAWQHMQEQGVAVLNDIARYKASAHLSTANVHFTGGGMLSFVCTSCTPTEQGTLRVESPDGELNFIPMQHIREYSVRPHVEEKPAETDPEQSAMAGMARDERPLESGMPAGSEKTAGAEKKPVKKESWPALPAPPGSAKHG